MLKTISIAIFTSVLRLVVLGLEMEVALCIAVASFIVNTIEAVKPKDVNRILETVPKFDKEARAIDLAVIDKVQNFLDQIKNAMGTNARRNNNHDNMTFTAFLLKFARIMKKLDDDDLEEAFIVIIDESKRYINMETGLRQFFKNEDMRRFVSNKLDDIKELTANDLRRHIDSIVTAIQHTSKTGEKSKLLDIGNTLFDGAGYKLRLAFKRLDTLRRSVNLGLPPDIVNTMKSTMKGLVTTLFSVSIEVRGLMIRMVEYLFDKAWDKAQSYLTTKLPNALRNHVHENKKRTKAFRSLEKGIVKPQEVFLIDLKLNSLLRDGNIPTKPNSNKNKKPKVNLNRQASEKKKGAQTTDKEIIGTRDSEGQIFTGGQISRNIHLRGVLPSSVESTLDDDKKEDGSSIEEIVIQHTNFVDVGLSQKEPGKLNITFVSTENDKNEFNYERRVIRKSNVNDILQVPINVNSQDLNNMIKRLEEQLQTVNDQVAYVKNLTHPNNAVLRFGYKSENATEPEIVNETRSFSFRPQYDINTNSSEINTNQTATNDSPANTTVVNEKKEMSHEENEPANAKNKESHGTGEENDKHDANEANHDYNEGHVNDIN